MARSTEGSMKAKEEMGIMLLPMLNIVRTCGWRRPSHQFTALISKNGRNLLNGKQMHVDQIIAHPANSLGCASVRCGNGLRPECLSFEGRWYPVPGIVSIGFPSPVCPLIRECLMDDWTNCCPVRHRKDAEKPSLALLDGDSRVLQPLRPPP
jgi:hypothetical protein